MLRWCLALVLWAHAAFGAEPDGPVALRARRIKLPADMDGSAFVVPFAATTAAASFRQGGSTYVVFDERRPVDMAALKDDPVFGTASVQLLAGGTLFRLPQLTGQSVALTQIPRGWRIAALSTAPKPDAIGVTVSDGRMGFTADQPGDVVVLADPDTGATLLAGTQHRPGQGIASPRRNAQFALRPSLQGVVVESIADTLGMKPTGSGFSLSGGPAGLALSPVTATTAGLMDAARLTRRLDLPTMPRDALFHLLIHQLGTAAAAPPGARGPYRQDAARTMLALGFSAEAQSLLRLSSGQDPRIAASPDAQAMTAIAALLANRPEEADGLDNAELTGTDEIALWRAIRLAMRDEGSPAAAAVFASAAPLAFQYPEPIRDRIVPLIAETMILGGEIPAAARIIDQRKADPHLTYARALLRQAEGDTGQALALYDGLAAGHDQLDRARAAVRAVELRLAANQIDKSEAANALDRLLYVWRGDTRELALRERVAELRGQTGAWRPALDLLRQARADFPDDAVALQERIKSIVTAMIRDQDDHPTPPFEFVSTINENADVLSGSGDDTSVEKALAEHLVALDLPARARPVLEKLLRTAGSPVAKAEFGCSLASLDEREGNHGVARAALDASEMSDLPPDLAERRAIVRAGAMAGSGNDADAVTALLPFHSARAAETRATIAEAVNDWGAAQRAWSDRLAAEPQDADPVTEATLRILVRLAAAAARASDNAELARLRERYGERIGAGPVADMFRMLTAPPIQSSGDLTRSHSESVLTASIPASMAAARLSTAPR